MIPVFILLILFSNIAISQNIETQQWKNRVLVIYADKNHAKKVENQFNLIKHKRNDCLDRKLILYKCIGSHCYYYDWVTKPKAIMIEELPNSFSVQLIGLDGTIKFESTTIVRPKKIFDIIDTMPMRQRELKRRAKSN